MTLPSEIQLLSPGDKVTLFDLDMSKWNGGVFRFVAGTLGDGQVAWRGNTYTPIPVKAEGFEKSGRGKLPTPKMSIAKVPFIASAMRSFDNLRGARVIRWQTFKHHLDGQAQADPNVYFPLDIYFVERKLSERKQQVVWELSASIDQQGKKIPGRVATQDACQWIYRVWSGGAFDYTHADCPYNGAAMFTDTDEPTTDPAQDRCSHRFSGCERRYGSSPMPMGAFPGMARARY